MHLFINENEDYRYENAGKPIWTIDGFKYGDWTPTGTFTKFFEFPISEVIDLLIGFRISFILFLFPFRMCKIMVLYFYTLLLLNMAIQLIQRIVILILVNIRFIKANVRSRSNISIHIMISV